MDFTSLTTRQVLDLGKPCKEFEEILKTHKPSDGINRSDPDKALVALRQKVFLHDQADRSDPEVHEETLHAPAQDGFLLPLKVFRHATPSTDTSRPLIVLYYPGGFILGSPTLMAPLARLLAKRFNAVVVAPTYRLAPEHPFPTGFNDGWDALFWIASNAIGVLHADPSKGFVVGGISSGGNVSNVVTHLARDNGMQPPITGVWLSCVGIRVPRKDADLLPEKYRERNLSRFQDECVNSVVTTPEMKKFGDDLLKPDVNSNLYAPLLWPTGHGSLPKTCFQVCGMDAARDEALIFEDMLKNEGIPTRLDLYPGLPHAFWISFGDLPQSKAWRKDFMDGFAWLLEL